MSLEAARSLSIPELLRVLNEKLEGGGGSLAIGSSDVCNGGSRITGTSDIEGNVTEDRRDASDLWMAQEPEDRQSCIVSKLWKEVHVDSYVPMARASISAYSRHLTSSYYVAKYEHGRIPHVKHVITADPENDDVKRGLAEVYEILGETRKALNLARRKTRQAGYGDQPEIIVVVRGNLEEPADGGCDGKVGKRSDFH
ncbi:hypothetical protein BDM02DRAFT_3128298 [Thelephora ganbajun]|uniref:Uncharacterized protein n=1 Tax=Thelephora ganbajun TaxID=370292 RepID=A0ACB6ZKB7_THEGA|nr:hypothetical protein BDM02DRAFT_3128298 [Thelephora ganbajun]